MTLLLTGADVAELLTLDDCIAAVEDAFRAHGEGTMHAPGILSAHAERGAFHIKTASVNGRFGAKANANFPGQTPSIQGVMLLFDESNGRLLALLDSIELTILRTGAATAVAAKYLAPADARSAMIYGAGKQGRVQLEALSRVRRIERAVVHDVDDAKAQMYASEMSAKLGIEVTCGRASCDVVITCTPSKEAFLYDEAPFIAAVGADNPGKSEIAPSLMHLSRVVTDLTEQAAQIGDLRAAIAVGAMSRDDVHAELGEIVAGRKPGRTRDDEVFVFDSTGIGFQDTAAASIVYDRALAQRRGLEVNLAR
ncbi:MAG TPA: ornithine cyclodeaminase family protein [Thermoanaerobaculia bacterium]|nr:ornithine cyclodeaminase family protein [Thermoanaerobaculia bacterium]